MDFDTHLWLMQRWQKGNRYYVAEVTQDLFGAWLFKRSWGSVNTHRGRNVTVYADGYDHALKLFIETEKRRKQRGYVNV